MPEELAVWLYGINAGTLAEGGRGLSFRFSEAAYRRWGLRSPILSLSMPVSTRPYGHGVAAPFFEGLLPEGQLRRTIAYDLRISEIDTFGLLAEIGRDCAGAVVVQPEAEGAPPGSAQAAEPIGADEVAERIARLPVFPLGVDDRVRVSLPGMQNKLLLTKTPAGWALPIGAPSTHILKPAIHQFPYSVENEDFCMRLARRIGLRVATTRIERVAGSPVLVVERFDRVALPTGGVLRVHQEDVNQALGTEPDRKYEASGGPSLRRVASLLANWQVPVEELLGQVTFAVAVGDADHHAKNISFLHDEEGRIRITPLYDVMCIRYYTSVTTTPAMFVNGKRHMDEIRADDLVAEGVAWGLPEADAESVVFKVLEALPEAIEAEAAASQWSPEPLVRFLKVRGQALHEAINSQVVSPTLAFATQPCSAPHLTSGRIWVHPYHREDGTPVRGHWRHLR